MKRVSGATWRDLLSDESHDGWKPLLAGHGHRARANVEILAQIARALSFAHERGIVHRDLKPENVMIGRFGEVYVLDWGVALEHGDSAPKGIVGTLGYLAPEMALADGRRIGPRTDVFLLGATLYELLTGRMPNAAGNAFDALRIALSGNRPPPEGPSDLVELATHALALDPERRPESAEAFRVALVRHLATRDIDALVEEASTSRSRAIGLREREGEASVAVFRALIEARFAMHTALTMRADDPRVRAELDACLIALAERDLALGSIASARTYYEELGSPRPELLRAIESAETHAGEEKQAAQMAKQSRAEADASAPSRMLQISTVLTAVWVFIGIQSVRSGDAEKITPLTTLEVNGALAIALSIPLFIFRKRVLATAATRRLSMFMVGFFLVLPAFELVALIRGEAVYDNLPGHLAANAYALAGVITFFPELWPVVAWGALMVTSYLIWPEHRLAIGHFGTGVSTLIIVHAIRRHAARTRRPKHQAKS
jgi:serine/threonine-protein kinase